MTVDYAGATIEWGTTPDTITLLELTKQLLGILDNSRDTELSMYLDMAGRACELYCDNTLVKQSVDEQFAFAHSPIDLRYWPAADITKVTVDGVDVEGDYELMTSDGITWVLKERCSSSHSDCFEQMTVTYSAGYDPLPSDLGYAIASTAAGYTNDTGVSGSVKKEVVNGVGSIEYDVASESAVGLISGPSISVLDAYRRMRV